MGFGCVEEGWTDMSIFSCCMSWSWKQELKSEAVWSYQNIQSHYDIWSQFMHFALDKISYMGSGLSYLVKGG